MIIKVEHIGIAVKDLSLSGSLFERLLGIKPYRSENVASEGVTTLFFKAGKTKIELVEASHSLSPVAKFIETRGEGVHHIALEVDDIKKEMKRIVKAGFTLINKKPLRGAENKLVCFIHPKSAGGVLVEICQKGKWEREKGSGSSSSSKKRTNNTQ